MALKRHQRREPSRAEYRASGKSVEAQRETQPDSESAAAARRPNGDKYWVPVTDNRGHSMPFAFRAQPRYARQIDLIIASKRFSFKTRPDVLRYALDHTLKELTAGDDTIPSIMAQVEAINEIALHEQLTYEFVAMFVRCSKIVTDYCELGAKGEARRVVALIKAHVDQMPEGFWREKYLRELMEKFGHLTTAPGEGVSLRVSEETMRDTEDV